MKTSSGQFAFDDWWSTQKLKGDKVLALRIFQAGWDLNPANHPQERNHVVIRADKLEPTTGRQVSSIVIEGLPPGRYELEKVAGDSRALKLKCVQPRHPSNAAVPSGLPQIVKPGTPPDIAEAVDRPPVMGQGPQSLPERMRDIEARTRSFLAQADAAAKMSGSSLAAGLKPDGDGALCDSFTLDVAATFGGLAASPFSWKGRRVPVDGGPPPAPGDIVAARHDIQVSTFDMATIIKGGTLGKVFSAGNGTFTVHFEGHFMVVIHSRDIVKVVPVCVHDNHPQRCEACATGQE